MKIVSLNGAWKLKEAVGVGPEEADPSRGEWLPASVPGCVYTDLMAAGRIPDPFYRLNEAQVQWVADKDWLYVKTFELDAGTLSRDRVQLVCNGLDTFATIWLNGEELAKTENAFVEHVFDVRDDLEEGENVLAIRFDSALRICAERETKHGVLPGGARVYARKPQYTFGWDWAPKLPYCGIWRDAFVRAFDHGRIRSVYAPARLADGKGAVNLSIELERTDETPLAINATLTRGDKLLAQAEAHDVEGSAELVLTIDRPLAWWPSGCGDPDLYDLCVRLRKGEEELDRREARIGFRTCEIEREPDAAGESFIFKINGRRLFCKGANWVPADSFPPRVTAEKYRALLELAVEQNLNMLRVWGGGIYENDIFYDICDELGILVWQDFPFACADYPDVDWFGELVEREAELAVTRLRNHPSLAVWCGNNENHMGHDNWGWPEKFSSEPIYHRVLPAVCERLDPGRPYWPGSPYGGDNSNSETHGDNHYWKVWHGGCDYTAYLQNRARFISEFGFQSFPTMDTVLAFAEPEDLSMDAEVIAAHQKSRNGNDRLKEAVDLFFPQPDSFERAMLFTQMIHGEAMKTGIEHWRRLKWHTSGALVWQHNDCWPVVSWAMVDYELRPKPAYYHVRRACAPVLITAHVGDDEVAVWGINDTDQVVSGTLDIERFDMRGEAELLRTDGVLLAPDSSCELCRLPANKFQGLDRRRHFLWLTFYSGIYTSSATLFFVHPKDLAFLEPDISVEVAKDEFDSQRTVQLTSPVFVKGVWLSVPGTHVRFSDNAFDLIPYVSRDVTVDFRDSPPIENLLGVLKIQHCNRVPRPDT